MCIEVPSMPLYEFECRACRHSFETLVRGREQPSCPSCGAQDIERLLSSFGVGSEARSHSNLQAARRTFTYSTARQDQIRHEAEVVRDHVQEDYGLRVPKPKD
jgi:putative FmdB family regulatory protein